jgi:hypothetical protein
MTERQERLEREAAEHNAQIIPDTPGAIRVDGPRRQYRKEVRGGVMHLIEI